MSSRKAQVRRSSTPSSSIVIWLAGLVFGVSAGLLLVYHFLLASRSTSPMPMDVVEASTSPALHRPLSVSARTVDSAHSEAMREALRTEGP